MVAWQSQRRAGQRRDGSNLGDHGASWMEVLTCGGGTVEARDLCSNERAARTVASESLTGERYTSSEAEVRWRGKKRRGGRMCILIYHRHGLVVRLTARPRRVDYKHEPVWWWVCSPWLPGRSAYLMCKGREARPTRLPAGKRAFQPPLAKRRELHPVG